MHILGYYMFPWQKSNYMFLQTISHCKYVVYVPYNYSSHYTNITFKLHSNSTIIQF